MVKSDIGRCLRIAQVKRDITGVELAGRCGVKPQQLARWRNSENMRVHQLQVLCSALDMGVDEFLALDK